MRDHVVQFYGSDDFLNQEVTRWFEIGFRADDACIVVATEAHRTALADELGGDADRILFLDAAQQLEGFAGADGVDPWRFEHTVGSAVERAAAEGRRVRAFGEMVALLAARGRHADALALETCWCRLMRRTPVDLLCAYPLSVFDRAEDREAFRAVCRAHSHVRPAEQPSVPDAAVSLGRALAEIQQQSVALEHEGRERRRLEHALGEQRLAAGAAPAPGPAHDPAATHRRGARQVAPRTVLVVDDDPRVAETLARWLRASGHAVQTATDGASAIAEVVRTRPEVVLLDIAMPKIDGYEVARRLRALPALHAFVLVALTGLAEPEDVARAQRAGFDHHLAKPPDLARLEAILRGGF